MSYFHFQVMAHFIIYYLNFFPYKWPEAVIWRCSVKNFTKVKRKYLYRSLFFNKVAGFQSAILLKTNSGAGVSMWISMWILWNCEEYSFCKASAHDCFWMIFRNSSFDKRCMIIPEEVCFFRREYFTTIFINVFFKWFWWFYAKLISRILRLLRKSELLNFFPVSLRYDPNFVWHNFSKHMKFIEKWKTYLSKVNH